jgi:hypothetical protein
MREDSITGIFKALMSFSPKQTQLSLVNTILQPFEGEILDTTNPEFEIGYGLRTRKIQFNSVPSGVIKFENSNPDLWIKISQGGRDLKLIIVEVKIGNYSFTNPKNIQQIAHHYSAINKYDNTFLIGISDGACNIEDHERFCHYHWNTIIANIIANNDHAQTNILLEEFRRYKDMETQHFTNFSTDFLQLFQRSHEQRQMLLDSPYEKVKNQVEKLLDEIISTTASELDEYLDQPPHISKARDIGPRENHNVIWEIADIDIREGVKIRIQFSVPEIIDKTRFVASSIINKQDENLELIQFIEDNKNLFSGNNNVWQDPWTYELQSIYEWPYDWSSAEWVSELKQHMISTAVLWYRNISNYYDN